MGVSSLWMLATASFSNSGVRFGLTSSKSVIKLINLWMAAVGVVVLKKRRYRALIVSVSLGVLTYTP